MLPALAQAPDAAVALASYQPVHAGYRALKAQLAAMKDSTGAAASHAAIPGGPSLKSGMKDARVPAIRERLGLPAQSGLIYDDEMADMVAEMQRSRGLKPTGRFDERTASALSGEGRTAGISPGDIIANMERWRWLPQDLGERHISVNVPDFSLALVDGDRTIHTSRVIVGKPETPTPMFSQAMQYVIVNPYWNIPPSILRKEILPGLAQDPEYAAKRGYESDHGATAPCPSGSRRASAMRWGSSSSSSRTSTRSTCTTRRRAACSPTTGARSAMAACASTSPSGWLNSCWDSRATTKSACAG